MKTNRDFLFLLSAVVAVGLALGLAIRFWSCDRGPAQLAVQMPSISSTKLEEGGFEALDASGELLARLSPFKAGLSRCYVEVRLENITKDRRIDIEYIKIVFFDEEGAYLDHAEGKIDKALKPGDVVEAFLYVNRAEPAGYYAESASATRFEWIGRSIPYKPLLRDS
jgi:hypothetical protein